MSFYSLVLRYMCAKNDYKRDKGLSIPKELDCFRNIRYGKDRMNVLDVYRPKTNGKLPVIISVHGGAWVYGSKEVYKHYCASLAQRGFVVINFSYRLSPRHKFPCHLEDSVKVVNWLYENLEVYGMDENAIFAVGDSAGAHILSHLCTLNINPDFAANFNFKINPKFAPKAVALNCGFYDASIAKESEMDITNIMNDVLQNKGTQEELNLVSSISHITKEFPPTYIMSANADFLQNQVQPLANKLESLHVPYKLKIYGDDTNKLEHVFHLDMRSEFAKLCNDEECEYFKSFI